jgi:hypothetical protein
VYTFLLPNLLGSPAEPGTVDKGYVAGGGGLLVGGFTPGGGTLFTLTCEAEVGGATKSRNVDVMSKNSLKNA